jgi:hypothetical protein
MYEKEAGDIINIVFESGDDEERVQRVAHYLRELIAAREYGCTGLQADPDGPTLAGERDAALDQTLGAAGRERALEDTPDLSRGWIPSPEDWARVRRTRPEDEFTIQEPPAPVGLARYCARCAASGVGVCDDYPNCPAGQRVRDVIRNDFDME